MDPIEPAATPNEPAIETPEIDIDDNLGDAFDRIQKGEPAHQEPEPAIEPGEPQGDLVTKDGETEDPGQPGEPQDDKGKPAEGEPATFSTDAPASWSQEAKDKFKEADPMIQEQVLKREQDFLNGFEKHRESAQVGTEFKEAMAPYEIIMREEGGTPISVLQNMMSMAYVMRKGTPEQKRDLLLNAARNNNVDLGQIQPQDSGEDFVDPEMTDLKKQVADLSQKLTTQQNNDKETDRQNGLRFIDEFKTRKDGAGNDAHPHFEKVRTAMGALITSGHAKTMEEAYEQATYANPEIRANILDAKNQADDKERLEDAKRKAAKAKKTAGIQVATKGTGNVALGEKGWDEDLSDVYDKITA